MTEETWFDLRKGKEIFCFPKVDTGPIAHLASYSNISRVYFPAGKSTGS
jgi:hypothetical protein